MAFVGNTVLITGGSSGIGLQMARHFLNKGNKVIICARSVAKLDDAQRHHPGLLTYACDLTKREDCEAMAEWIRTEHPELNVLINNAAIVHKGGFLQMDEPMEHLAAEVTTNFAAPVHLISLLYPLLLGNANAQIINITSGLVYMPKAEYAFYNATKAALHSFTQVLRYQLRHASIRVVEVLFPAVDTPWHQGNPPKIAISAQQAVTEMIKGLDAGKEEIKVGGVKLLYALARIAPSFAFKKINSL